MSSSPPVRFAKATTIVSALALLAACGSKESNLEKMAQSDAKGEVQSEFQSSGEVAEGEGEGGGSNKGTTETKVEQPPSADQNLDEHGIPIPPQEGEAKLISPGADEDRVQLRLALAEGSRYRITTIGMLELPLLNRATGFAREEEVALSDCKGEAGERSCLASHTYRNYEAEPPAGSGLEADEKLVAELETAHRIDASGLRMTTTAVHGESGADIAKQLAEVHRLNCIRLPDVPVGVGATWRDVCRMRQGGTLVTREVTWRLAKVEAGEDGRRAQLEYAGRIRKINSEGEVVNGDVKGAVYFWLDAGEPHLVREALGFVLNADKGIGVKTDFRYQYTKVDEDGETLIRTDGKAFEQSPQALNNPRATPFGATRDAEQPSN